MFLEAIKCLYKIVYIYTYICVASFQVKGNLSKYCRFHT
jgi:hypothetical protein